MRHMNIPIARPDLSGNESKYVLDAIAHEGRISSSGIYLDRFESLAATRFGRVHALSVSNGTTALHLALRGLDIGPGDEVIVPSFTFAATAAAVVHCGATPVFVDVRADDWMIDPAALDAVRTTRTKAVIAVDLYGMPCNYQALQDWCTQHHLSLIEDAAEAHGARYHDKPVGSFGHVSCFSFYGNKILTTGEGGMCLTDDPDLFERMRVLKNHGMKKPGVYEHAVVGYNYRMTNLQAAIGCAQFERFDQFLEARRTISGQYMKQLSKVEGITLQHSLDSNIQPVFWLFSILIDKSPVAIAAHLKAQGIETRPVFKPMHMQEAYRVYIRPGQTFPVSESLSSRGISLPSSSLMTEEEVNYVCTNLREALHTV